VKVSRRGLFTFSLPKARNETALCIVELAIRAAGTVVGGGALLFREVEKGVYGKTSTQIKLTSLKEKRLIKEISLITSKWRGKRSCTPRCPTGTCTQVLV
jgi:hypothetical protein